MSTQREAINVPHDEAITPPRWLNLAMPLRTWTAPDGSTYVEGVIYAGDKRFPTKAAAEQHAHEWLARWPGWVEYLGAFEDQEQ